MTKYKGYRKYSFLWLAQKTLGQKNMKSILEKQYFDKGPRWMEKYWGYHKDVIVRQLRGLDICTVHRSKNYNKLHETVMKHGGIGSLMNFYGNCAAIAKEVGFSYGCVYKYLRYNKWSFNKEEGRWERDISIT